MTDRLPQRLSALARAITALVAGRSPWSDSELTDQFLAVCSRSGSDETKAGYRRDLGTFAAWLEVQHPGQLFCEATPEVASEYLSHLGELLDNGDIARRTYNRRISTVQALWRWASDPTRSGVSGIARSIWPRRSLLPVAKTARPVAPSDLDMVLDAIRSAALQGSRTAHRDYVIIRALFLTGARVSEFACLRWQDLERLPGGGGQVHILGKAGKTRTLRISADTLALLESLGRGPANDWVFPGRNGGHLSRQAIGDRILRWGRSVGVHLHPHKLRHTHATQAIQRGCDTFTLQVSLGHVSADSTATYVATCPKDSSSLQLG
jgi:site-specific recombinase XerD